MPGLQWPSKLMRQVAYRTPKIKPTNGHKCYAPTCIDYSTDRGWASSWSWRAKILEVHSKPTVLYLTFLNYKYRNVDDYSSTFSPYSPLAIC